jgi:lipopolysaccharide transport system ATP-binding protein
MSSPIVGFSFRNNRGENLFGDNTFECYQNNPVRLSAGEVLEAVFEFEMPRLPSGEYAMHAAIADGTQDEHVQHQWFHNCLTMTSLYHGKTGVLVGIPMHGISLKKLGK